MSRQLVTLMGIVTLLVAGTTVAAGDNAPVLKPDSEGVIPSVVHKGDIVDFLKIMSVASGRNIVPSPDVVGDVSVNLYDVTAMEALEAVLQANGYVYEEQGPFIYVYTASEYASRQQSARKRESRVYRLNYLRPTDVVSLLEPLLSEEGVVTTSPEDQPLAGEGGEGWAGSNYVIVRDFQEQHEQITKLLEEMDRKPQQVLVEATILVAQLDDTNELGVDFSVLGGVNFQAKGGVVGTVPEGSVSLDGTTGSVGTSFAGNVTSGGLSIGVVSSNVGIFVEALESVTDVVTLGNPKVLTVNRHQGKVIVGNRDGYITTEVSQTTTTQTVEFLETGTQLAFRPFVMDDGYIRMELNPKDSDGGVDVEGNFTLPSESTAEVTTNVLVKDGHTIVIGGLFRERNSIGRSQVPLLGNLPGVGTLFRSISDSSSREEVIFLITPHVVKEGDDYAAGERALQEADRMLLGMREGLQWYGRRQLAATHYRRALERQAAGDTQRALWDATLACWTSPSLTDALRLRDELRGCGTFQVENSVMRTFMRDLVKDDVTPVSAVEEVPFWVEHPVERTAVAEPVTTPMVETAAADAVAVEPVIAEPTDVETVAVTDAPVVPDQPDGTVAAAPAAPPVLLETLMSELEASVDPIADEASIVETPCVQVETIDVIWPSVSDDISDMPVASDAEIMSK